MIKFYFEDQFSGARASAMVTTQAESINGVVSAFKVFLSLVGYAQDTIERITIKGEEQGFTAHYGDGNPDQGDFFADDEDDGSESGV